jgi:pimeloyl-ACP methyl ester carboxylesterase
MLILNDDHQIHYERIEGDPHKPVLVFLHEGLGCTAAYKGFPERLCKKTGCPGLVYDRLGYGQSWPLTGPFTIHFMHYYALNELPQVLCKLIPGKAFFLIGHSDGGSISLIYGAEKSPLLKAIITEAAHVFVDPKTLDGIQKAVAAYQEGKLSGLFKYHGEKTDPIFKAWSGIWLSDGFRHWNIEYVLPSIQCPVLAIQGREDPYGTDSQIHSISSKISGPVDFELLENCGHTPHHQLPEKSLDIMSRFIEYQKNEPVLPPISDE